MTSSLLCLGRVPPCCIKVVLFLYVIRADKQPKIGKPLNLPPPANSSLAFAVARNYTEGPKSFKLQIKPFDPPTPGDSMLSFLASRLPPRNWQGETDMALIALPPGSLVPLVHLNFFCHSECLTCRGRNERQSTPALARDPLPTFLSSVLFV